LLDSTAGCGKPHVRWCGRGNGRNPVAPTRSEQIGFRQINDCIHTAIAEKHCTELITYNKKDFSKIAKLTSINIKIL
jgi:predicted nucleic acid-binding protein